jgi:hypothetical protein
VNEATLAIVDERIAHPLGPEEEVPVETGWIEKK